MKSRRLLPLSAFQASIQNKKQLLGRNPAASAVGTEGTAMQFKIALLSLAALLPSGAFAGTWYVDALSGSDTNACTAQTAACQTVSAAYTKAAAGDTIYVAEGTYGNESSWCTNGTLGKNVSLIAQGRATITSSINVCVVTLVQGFTFQDATVYFLGGTIRHNRFLDTGGGPLTWVYMRQDPYWQASSFMFEGNLFYNLGGVGYALSNGNVFPNQRNFKGNTFYKIANSCVQMTSNEGTSLIVNNIFDQCGTAVAAQGASDAITVDYNDFFQNGTDITGQGQTNLTVGSHNMIGSTAADPKFLDAANLGFMLQPTSPLVGAGRTEAFNVNYGVIPNIGAFGAGLFSDPAADQFAGWVDGAGTPVGSSSQVSVTSRGYLQLNGNTTSASVLSPVVNLGKLSVLHSLSYEALQDLTPPAGQRRAVGSDPTTDLREVQYRASASSFAQNDQTVPWVTVERDQLLGNPARVQYVQVQITLRSNAQ